MPNIPDRKEIPGRKDLRDKFYTAGGLLIIVAGACAYYGNAQGFLIAGALGGVSIFIGTKIKTHRKLKGYGGVYE